MIYIHAVNNGEIGEQIGKIGLVGGSSPENAMKMARMICTASYAVNNFENTLRAVELVTKTATFETGTTETETPAIETTETGKIEMNTTNTHQIEITLHNGNSAVIRVEYIVRTFAVTLHGDAIDGPVPNDIKFEQFICAMNYAKNSAVASAKREHRTYAVILTVNGTECETMAEFSVDGDEPGHMICDRDGDNYMVFSGGGEIFGEYFETLYHLHDGGTTPEKFEFWAAQFNGIEIAN